MRIGVNYPWLDYGWDFGSAPAPWRSAGEVPRWYALIDEHLARLRRLGVSVVRWFVLADGLAYGSGAEAPRPGTRHGGEWCFDPPPLGPDVLTHFEEVLRRFARVNAQGGPPIQLLPVLLDFHFCAPGVWPLTSPDPQNPRRTAPDEGWVKQGRADVVRDSAKRERFFDRALEPLLRVSQRHADAIYAWDLMNEPDWVTKGWHVRRLRDRSLDSGSMRAFLEEGVTRIRRAGHRATIGFASLKTLRRAQVPADIDQFHHYPGGRRRLERCRQCPDSPLIIGEFATATTDAWPDLGAGEQTVLDRLRLVEAQGYPLAIAWSFLATDRHSDWHSAEAALGRLADASGRQPFA